MAASVPGYHGFAVGRSAWLEPLSDFVGGLTDREEAVTRIGTNYLDLVTTFAEARSRR